MSFIFIFISQAYSINGRNGAVLIDNTLSSKSELHYMITMRGDVVIVAQTGAKKNSFTVKGPVYNLERYTKSNVSFDINIPSMLFI